jgi:hypothetical protein
LIGLLEGGYYLGLQQAGGGVRVRLLPAPLEKPIHQAGYRRSDANSDQSEDRRGHGSFRPAPRCTPM